MKSIKIGIVVADNDEYKPLADCAERGVYEPYRILNRVGHKFSVSSENGEAEVISVLSGIGKVNAAAAAMHLVDKGCNIILNYGLSGGICGISRGEICVCDKFLEHDFDLTGIGYKPCEKPGQEYVYKADSRLIEIFENSIEKTKTGTAVTGDSFICDADIRNGLRDKFGAMSCDMESAAIAYVCAFSGVPFFSLRRVSDNAGADAVDSYREMNKSGEVLLSSYILDFIKAIINSDFAVK